MPKVSVIIPCYNQGQYLEESIESVLKQTFQDFEIIVINDGSNDAKTIEILKNYQEVKTKIIHTKNQGVSQARNNGIKEAVGDYILPLDADDKIGTTYIEQALEILEQNPEIGIVYCDAELFGSKKEKWKLKEYKFPNILAGNCIFCSAMFRKTDWEKVGGYKKEMDKGLEDWEFWISLIEQGANVYKIPEVLFYYRQTENTMSKQATENRLISIKKIMLLHPKIYIEHLEQIILALSSSIAKFIPKNKCTFNLRTKIGTKHKLNIFLERCQ